jgi:CheY-like chemotaxis protein/DNA-directed RNA polymerase subunit RPC12/RpoP
MEIVCTSCKSKLRIPDIKLPPGKSASLRCPKCDSKIHLGSDASQAEAAAGDAAEQIMEIESASSEDLMQESFELARLGGKTALICEPHTAARDKLAAKLESAKYFTVEAEDTRNALKRMRYHLFDLGVVNENFDTEDPDANGVLIYLRHVEMNVRRHMFVIMITKRFRTLDQLTAMNRSVNMIFNSQHMDNLEDILSRSMTDNERFYDVYLTSMKKLGKI